MALCHQCPANIPWLCREHPTSIPWLCHEHPVSIPWLCHEHPTALCHQCPVSIPRLCHEHPVSIPQLCAMSILQLSTASIPSAPHGSPQAGWLGQQQPRGASPGAGAALGGALPCSPRVGTRRRQPRPVRHFPPFVCSPVGSGFPAARDPELAAGPLLQLGGSGAAKGGALAITRPRKCPLATRNPTPYRAFLPVSPPLPCRETSFR